MTGILPCGSLPGGRSNSAASPSALTRASWSLPHRLTHTPPAGSAVGPPASLKKDTLPRALLKLADRVADNRSVAGLHFYADNRAGNQVALRIVGRALKCPSIKALVTAVHNENL